MKHSRIIAAVVVLTCIALVVAAETAIPDMEVAENVADRVALEVAERAALATEDDNLFSSITRWIEDLLIDRDYLCTKIGSDQGSGL